MSLHGIHHLAGKHHGKKSAGDYLTEINTIFMLKFNKKLAKMLLVILHF